MTIQANFPAIKPSLMLDFANTKQLDSRITYTRASTASYYDGVTTSKAEENLFTYSQEFNNAAWTTNSGTITANAIAAPDGTTTAELLTISAQFGGVSQFKNLISGQQYTISFWALVNTGTNTYTVIDNGGGAGILGTYTPTGTWTRYSFTFTAGASPATLYIAQDRNASGFGSVYLWGAQVEQRSAVSAYTATTTQAITNYIPKLQSAASGVARFDNNPTTGESLGLLIEESRTNLLIYSSQFDDSAWTKTRSSTIANTIVAPDGTLTGDKLVEDTTATNTHLMFVNTGITLSTGVAYTYTIYAKAAERSICRLGNNDLSGVFFDLSAGTVTSVASGFTGSIVSVGNGWYRLTATQTSNSNVNGRLAVTLASTGTTTSYTGDGYSGIYIWGAQLELGAFATSYIPTVASQVTRAADAASMTGTNFSTWFNTGEGTLYAEGFTANTSTTGIVSINDNTGNNRIDMRLTLGTGVGSSFISVNGTNQALFTSNATANTQAKQVVAYKVDDFAFCRNAGTVQTDTSGTIPTLVTQMRIGTLDGATNNTWLLGGSIKKIAYYPIRVTNAQLQSLTS